ncbi:hypothetical protein CEXT_16491 [Caerostris extrusa]|uniref:Uncharacterized protein n=1 Tax=Caerostris extrusa TaxID=172846 RepID=A0AAV4RRN0_CAEEX|nr:hypothetical protein CEXT_16491 [Caerostris extrusa]
MTTKTTRRHVEKRTARSCNKIDAQGAPARKWFTLNPIKLKFIRPGVQWKCVQEVLELSDDGDWVAIKKKKMLIVETYVKTCTTHNIGHRDTGYFKSLVLEAPSALKRFSKECALLPAFNPTPRRPDICFVPESFYSFKIMVISKPCPRRSFQCIKTLFKGMCPLASFQPNTLDALTSALYPKELL